MNNNILLKKLKDLTDIPSVSGNETECALWIEKELLPFADKVYLDSVGNLIATKGKPRAFVFAHMDKIGYMVSGKTDVLIKVVSLKKGKGYPEEAKWAVTIYSKENISGLLSQIKEKERLQVLVDGKTLKSISVGDFVSLSSNFTSVGKDLICSQGLDNKLGVLAAIEVFKKAKNIGFVATVQEEISSIGAKNATFNIKPESVIVLDVTYDEGNGEIKVGDGPSICLKDDLFPDKKKILEILQIASQNRLKHQLEVLESGSSDAKGIYDVSGYTPFIFVGIPIKFMHSPNEVGSLIDLENTIKLLTSYFKKYE